MPRTALVRRTQSDRIDYAFASAQQMRGTYKLAASFPLPVKLLWSVTICDARTGVDLRVGQDPEVAATTLELPNETLTRPPRVYWVPRESYGAHPHWIKTMAGRGWFSYAPR
jgi:hypothetical protein